MSSSSSSSSFRSSDGDWICGDPECANLNFARRAACNRCGKDKIESSSKSKKQIGVEIGKAAAEKSRGLFSADDWQCTKCGNVNWARRQSCNMCNAPKFGEVEERTGLAGGYNDRGTVEYIRRDDSDDEYDEFGRKKKRFRRTTSENEDSSSPTKPENSVSSNLSEKHNDIINKKSEKESPSKVKAVSGKDERSDDEEEDDEDDDDDEDFDASKYDLSGWGDDDDDDKSDKEDKNTDKEPSKKPFTTKSD